jgi:thiamine biosynthesis lipoprotein
VFRDSSEVSLVNREAATRSIEISHELSMLLERCRELHDDTDGAFDITSTPLSRCWGFLQRRGQVPSPDAIDAARDLVGMSHVTLTAADPAVRFDRPGIELNVGAIGKGYAVDCMGAMLRRRGAIHALVSAGGSSVVAVGGHGGGWPVDISSPLLPGQRIARVLLRDAALGTSGAGEQFVVADGCRYGHVIDPRTGWPASGVLSCTVVSRHAADADALSTALLIGGCELAQRYCETHPETLALLVLDEDVNRVQTFGHYSGARIEA